MKKILLIILFSISCVCCAFAKNKVVLGNTIASITSMSEVKPSITLQQININDTNYIMIYANRDNYHIIAICEYNIDIINCYNENNLLKFQTKYFFDTITKNNIDFNNLKYLNNSINLFNIRL